MVLDAVLATLDTKLRRVENLDRALHVIMQKLDRSEADRRAILSKLDRQAKIEEGRFKVVVEKFDYLTAKFDSVCEEDLVIPPTSERGRGVLFTALPSNRRRASIAEPPGLAKGFSTSFVSESVLDNLHETISVLDRRLAFHANIVSENIGQMRHDLQKIGVRATNGTREERALDKLVTPMLQVRPSTKPRILTRSATGELAFQVESQMKSMGESMSEIKGLLDEVTTNTKFVLHNSQRQDAVISTIQSDFQKRSEILVEKLEEVSMVHLHTRAERIITALLALFPCSWPKTSSSRERAEPMRSLWVSILKP